MQKRTEIGILKYNKTKERFVHFANGNRYLCCSETTLLHASYKGSFCEKVICCDDDGVFLLAQSTQSVELMPARCSCLRSKRVQHLLCSNSYNNTAAGFVFDDICFPFVHRGQCSYFLVAPKRIVLKSISFFFDLTPDLIIWKYL